MKHLFFISSLIILTSTYFSRSLDYSILFLWRTITSPSFLQHTWECSRHFFFYNILPTFYIQFENVLCDYINLNDSKYSISPLKAFVHRVATIHKNEFIKNSKYFFPASFSFIFVFSIQLAIGLQIRQWLDANRGSLVSEATALPTELQPLRDSKS